MTVIFVPIPRDRVLFEWERIAALLGKAINMDSGTPPHEVRDWLTSGRSEAFWVGVYPNCTGICVTTIIEAGADCVCFIEYAAGTISGGPRKFIKTVRVIVGEIEHLARKQGCTELRIEGRNWKPILDEWERFDDGHPNRMRKRLDG